MRKGIILGIGILILLLALADTGSAKDSFRGQGINCGYCHIDSSVGTLREAGLNFQAAHKFNGDSTTSNLSSCSTCHVDMEQFLSLTATGLNYSENHRYNATTLASEILPVPGCANCHVDAIKNNFALKTGASTYLGSSVCKDCHSAKYDKWSNTLHAVMLTPKDKAQEMGLKEPEVGWADISYVIVSKFELAYINSEGYFLSQNDAYETETMEFADSHAGAAYGTCASCHTTGWNTTGWSASQLNGLLPGINGTFAEPGITCERCHGAGGNGHQVVVNYSSSQCAECHTGSRHGTGWENGAHAPPTAEPPSGCTQCHSPFDKYKNNTITEESATNVACGVCHDIHDMTDAKYADTFTNNNFSETVWSEVADSKLSFFNATASIAAGTDVFDNLTTSRLIYPGSSSGLNGSINLTGKPDSEVLCSKCHYNHGIGHMPYINLTHGAEGERATCVDCHMEGANAKVGKGMMMNHDNKIDSGKSCGGVICHGTSDSSSTLVANGSRSMQKRYDEWGASLHNDKAVGGFAGPFNATTGIGKSRANSCNVCHDPMNWNPATDSNYTAAPIAMKTFKGITCSVCHNLHDMGDWWVKTFALYGATKDYALYEKVLIGTRYKGTYRMLETSTELCGSCHSNDHPRLKAIGSYAEAGWPSDQANPNSPHGFPAAELFVGSWKQTGLLEFECTTCHIAALSTYPNGTTLPQDERVRGHSFQANATLLQNKTGCASCHVTGSTTGNISTTIEVVQTRLHNKYNDTNANVTADLATVKASSGNNATSRVKIAQAYWNVRLVNSDKSWGVHNPQMVDQLLDDAATLSAEAIAALPGGTVPTGDVDAWDTDNSGTISKTEALAAVANYFTPGGISKTTALAVVAAFFAGHI